MKHTKEPWQCDKYNNVNDSNGRTIKVQGFALSGGGEIWANSQRIVACVNACSGLTNEQLGSGYIQNLIKDYDKAMIMAKELNTMLEGFLKEYKNEVI
ncbi:MAG: hypothetical protein ACXVH2_00810 [Methanobacterium sp.]